MRVIKKYSDTDKDIKKSIVDRKADFKKSLQPFLDEYGKDLLNDFYLYWTEKKPKGKKIELPFVTDAATPFELWKKQ